MDEKKYHRIRQYQGKWSTLDEILECSKPKWCIGCEYKHPVCTQNGKVLELTETK